MQVETAPGGLNTVRRTSRVERSVFNAFHTANFKGDRMSSAPRTLAEKIWDAHVVRSQQGEPDLLFIDLHLVHEVTSPQAFDGLRAAGRKVRRPDLTVGTEDHNVPTAGITRPGVVPVDDPDSPITDPVSRTQI